MSVRVAVIGAGVMGADHARFLAGDVPGASLQVVCDPRAEQARDVAETCGALEVATDAMATVHNANVDAVLIASPDSTHAELTIAAIKAGKPVLCEKPLAPTTADCLSVIEAECALGRQLVQVGFMRRFDQPYIEMKEALHSGQIGRPVMMHNFHRNVEAPPSFTGPMAITNSAPHEFDIVRFVLGSEIASISSFEANTGDQVSCNPVVMVMETQSGQLITVEVNNNARYGYDVRGELVGTLGSITFAGNPATRIDKDFTSGTRYAEDWRPRFREAYRRQNAAWVKSIATGVVEPQSANAWDGYCATVIADAGAAALQSGQRAKVELVERPSLYLRSGAGQ